MRGMLGRALLAFTLLVPVPSAAYAQVDVSRVWAEHPDIAKQLGSLSRSRLLLAPRQGKTTERVVPINEHFELVAARPGEAWAELHWSPRRRLLLDRARAWIEHSAALALLRSSGAANAGEGVVIGVVDSGVAPSHPALQNPDGSTRITWFIDFQTAAYGLHPQLEDELGCTSGLLRCAILSRSDIDQLLRGEALLSRAGSPVALPRDPLGHGTHVASLAAGSDESGSSYLGVAPAADLIIANVSGSSLAVEDADVLLATRFIYQQAREAGSPAVVNLSLGGNFGPHDGSSVLARALESFLGTPGRAMVVSAGNSSTLLDQAPSPYPSPLGIHTDIHVSPKHKTRVPLLVPPDAPNSSGALFVYIASRSMDQLSVGLELADGTPLVAPQSPNEATMADDGRLRAIVINRAAPPNQALVDTRQGAAVVLSGNFHRAEVVAITLTGSGNAQLWVESEGPLTRSAYGGAMFPSATSASTVTIPAAAEGLIAVGATWNREQWPAFASDGQRSSLAVTGTPGEVAYFSSRGPNLLGTLKPDILAPGAAIIGAMAPAAVPLHPAGQPNPSSMFASTPWCSGVHCAVVDEAHAVALGTSMAAPLVTGVVALLLQRQPQLTQSQVRTLLQAGARQLPPSKAPRFVTAPGLLDAHLSLRALEWTLEDGARTALPSPRHSWIGISSDIAHPDPEWEVCGLLHLRDARGALADVPAAELELRVDSGHVTRPLTREAPSLYSFGVAAQPLRGGTLRLRVRYDDMLLAEERVTIAVDSHVARRGFSLRGGCQYPSAAPMGGGALALLGLLWVRRRRRRAHDRGAHLPPR